jgi:hypothetical protein
MLVNSFNKRSHETIWLEIYRNDKIIKPQTLTKYTNFINNFQVKSKLVKFDSLGLFKMA